MSQGMDNGYWVQAWTALVATKKMVKENAKGKIVFVSSTLGYMSFVGFASYSPAKHALRGLADTLASELQLYDIDVHIFFATTMATPGLEEEKKSKPAITSKIEGDDSPVSPESAAERMLKGVQKGHVHISGDFLTDVFRASTRGSAPYHNPVVDAVLGIIAWIGVPLWRRSVDAQIRAHRVEHAAYLSGK